MTIDERIERLTERHEALTQSVEIINHRVDALTHSVETLNHAVENLGEILRVNSERTDSKILALLTLAGVQQQRLDNLEGGRG